MQFTDSLIEGRLQRRYKRFLSDIELESGETVVAHCANPGSMLGLATPGARVWLSPANSPTRKLRYSWELVEVDGALVGINTGKPNGIVSDAIAAGRIPELAGYETARREVRYGRNSRIDILLENEPAGRPPCYVEIKSVTMKRGPDLAEFPDAVTQRGAKHLTELVEVAAGGARAVMLFLAQRSDCSGLTVADDIDPTYGRTLRDAMANGLEVLAYDCAVSPQAIDLNRRLALAL